MKSLSLLLALSLLSMASCKKKETSKKLASKPLVERKGTLQGISYSIGLPEEMKPETSMPGTQGKEATGIYWVPGGQLAESMELPHIQLRVRFMPPKDLKESLKKEMRKKDVLIKEEAVDGKKAHLIAYRSATQKSVTLILRRILKGKTITCIASQSTMTKIEDIKGRITWFEKVCRSMKAQ